MKLSKDESRVLQAIVKNRRAITKLELCFKLNMPHPGARIFDLRHNHKFALPLVERSDGLKGYIATPKDVEKFNKG
jgi:hypothetical protein